MLRASETCLSADDVAIVRCTVRHSQSANASYTEDATEMEDMMCTMRVWHKTKRPVSSYAAAAALQSSSTSATTGPGGVGRRRRGSLTGFDSSPLLASASAAASRGDFQASGPEVILSPISTGVVEHTSPHLCCSDSFADTPRLLSQRFTSVGSTSFEGPVRRYSLSTDMMPTRRIGNVTMSVKDIMMVDVHGSARKDDTNDTNNKKSSHHRINIVTSSSGVYEFSMDSANGRELLLAFLKANLPKDRINDQQQMPRSPSNLTLNTSHSNRSYDVEAFTATRMSERLKSESIGEKVQRRVHRLVSSFEESVSCAITECGPCGYGRAAVSPAPNSVFDPDKSIVMEKPDSPPGQRTSQHHGGRSPEGGSPQRSRPNVAFKENTRSSFGGNKFEMQPAEVIENQKDLLRQSHLPSGLSVESDPDNE